MIHSDCGTFSKVKISARWLVMASTLNEDTSRGLEVPPTVTEKVRCQNTKSKG